MVEDPEGANYIPDRLFHEIMKQLPIVSVDAIIVVDGALLLMKRNNSPAKGEWWLPGGRIHKDESPEEALRREVKEETGLEVISQRLVNVYSRGPEEKSASDEGHDSALNPQHSTGVLTALDLNGP